MDDVTLRDACQGILITGGTGSGKTSGSGAAIAGAFLRAGMGGLVLVAKPEEAELWRRYCKRRGRLGSLIEFTAATAMASTSSPTSCRGKAMTASTASSNA